MKIKNVYKDRQIGLIEIFLEERSLAKSKWSVSADSQIEIGAASCLSNRS